MTGEYAAEPVTGLVGVDDGLQRLWTPHRMAYIDSHNDAPAATECPFCAAPVKSDEAGLIVHRGETAYVILNLFPYNPGHLLVCPYRHVADYAGLTQQETREIAALTQHSLRVLRAASQPAGFNTGMNLGEVAGAGVAGHLHQHIVPRWRGDANFFPIIAETKAIPQLLADTRELLARTWRGGDG
ncbi:MAG: HIT domain-containing protein [Propionibacteriaceae bacterium]|jgi:ATP adenylyltransferase|nr:HIT domain-containing protein [Propionibacteriaceae bacterium]